MNQNLPPLHYFKTGDGNQIVVLIHGFMESSKIWDYMLPYFKNDYTFLNIDLPGHGDSVYIPHNLSMDSMASQIINILKKENFQDKKIKFVGHSMGGYVCLAIAEKYPKIVDSLSLFFSSPLEDDEEKKENRRRSFRIVRENLTAYVRAGIPPLFSPKHLNRLQKQVNLAKEIALKTNPEAIIACLKAMIERPERRHVLDDSRFQSIIVAGRFDNAIPINTVKNIYSDHPNVDYYELPCGHCGHWELPTTCAALLEEQWHINDNGDALPL